MSSDTNHVFEHDFANGLGPFRSHGNIETAITGTELRIELCPGKVIHKKHRKVGDGVFTKVCLTPGTKYKLSLLGRLSGNKTKIKINIYNKAWERVSLLEESLLKVSSEIDEAFIVFEIPESEDAKEKYYLVIAFCRCSTCSYSAYYSDTHFHKRAYLGGLKIVMTYDENDAIDGETVNGLHIKELDNTQLGSLMKFTMPDDSIQMKHDLEIQTAYIEHYIAVNVCRDNGDGTVTSEICHMPLYKLDEETTQS